MESVRHGGNATKESMAGSMVHPIQLKDIIIGCIEVPRSTTEV
jgi:hypothetical protein